MNTIFQRTNISEPALFSPCDTTKQIVGFPEICVSTFSENIIQKFSSLNTTQKIAELYTANGVIPVYKIRYKDTDIAFYLSRVGAPACVVGFEEIVAMGAKKFVLFGSCGVLDDDSVKDKLIPHFHGLLNIYCSDPFFLEIMPQNIDKAHSLAKLLSSIGLTTDQMICCGDGYNDITMIETAGLGVAMQNAQPLVREKADYITKSNDEDGVLHVIQQFLLD